MRSATFLIRSALSTEDPPHFCTTRATPTSSPAPLRRPGPPPRGRVRAAPRTLVGSRGYRLRRAALTGLTDATEASATFGRRTSGAWRGDHAETTPSGAAGRGPVRRGAPQEIMGR